MEQLKVKKKDNIVINSIIYLGMAFLFLYLQYAYRHQLSPFSFVYLRKGAELFWYVAIPIILAAVLLWRHHQYALASYVVSVSLVSFKVIEGLFIEFNKIIVIALFFFIVISYFLYQLLNRYFDLASINPNFSSQDLFDPLLKKIVCVIQFGEASFPGELTNWDEEGCFIVLKEQVNFPAEVSVRVHFHGREFVQHGAVVAETPDLCGVGIKFESTSRELNVFNWTEFTELVQELGFQPQRLR